MKHTLEFVVFPGIFVGMLTLTAINVCWVVPVMRESVRKNREAIEQVEGWQATEAKRMTVLEGAKQRQVMLEAELLLMQKQNQKLAEDLAVKLKALKGE